MDPVIVGDPVEGIRELTVGGVDAAIDASGSKIARRQAVRAVGNWGQMCFVGEGGDVTLNVSSDLLRRQVTPHGSWTSSTLQQATCLRFVADRGVGLDALFTNRWTLDDAAEAYRVFDQGSAGKGVFLAP
jgi:threonine dehydrogenase-like Zn-dependent dehydrogenase